MCHVLQCKPQILHKYFIQKHFLILLDRSVGDSMVYEPPPVFLVDRAGAATWIITGGSGTSSKLWQSEQQSNQELSTGTMKLQNYIL